MSAESSSKGKPRPFRRTAPTLFTRYFGDALRAARLHRSLTVEAVARLVGISIGHISELERGKKQASMLVVRKMEEALRIDNYALVRAHLDDEIMATQARLRDLREQKAQMRGKDERV